MALQIGILSSQDSVHGPRLRPNSAAIPYEQELNQLRQRSHDAVYQRMFGITLFS